MRKQEKFGLWRRAAREVIYALFIGALPLLISTSPKEVSTLVTALLAAPELMAYYVYLLIALSVRVKSPSPCRASQRRLVEPSHLALNF